MLRTNGLRIPLPYCHANNYWHLKSNQGQQLHCSFGPFNTDLKRCGHEKVDFTMQGSVVGRNNISDSSFLQFTYIHIQGRNVYCSWGHWRRLEQIDWPYHEGLLARVPKGESGCGSDRASSRILAIFLILLNHSSLNCCRWLCGQKGWTTLR